MTRAEFLRNFLASAAAMIGSTMIAAEPGAAQQLGQGGGAEISYWRVFFALLFCLALAAGVIFAMRHRLRGGRPAIADRFRWSKWLDQGERQIELIETLRLSHQTDICLVTVRGEEMLIAVSAAGVVRLDWIDGSKTRDRAA